MLPLATALVVHLRSQFNHVFALLVSMLHFKSINFCKNMPKIKLFWQKKNCKLAEQWGNSAPRPRNGPHCKFLATRQAKLTACV